jgi:hypothetical protein
MAYSLYIKTHNQTGLKYLGKTTQDPFTYKGSGIRWLRHINKHGYDVVTEVIGTYDTKEKLKEAGIYFSKLWNVVESDQWANLKLEEGDGGNPGPQAIKSISKKVQTYWDTGIYSRTWSDERNEKVRLSKIGHRNPMYGNIHAADHLNLEKYTCSKCGQTTTKGNYVRWHGDKCKPREYWKYRK